MGDRVPLPVLRKLTARDGHECAMTGTDTDRLVPQHRRGGMGGRANKHRLSNLVWLDSIANGLIESDRALQSVAKAWGVKISIHAATEDIPVFFPHRHAWFRLVGDTRIPVTALEALDRMHAFYGDEYFAWKAAADRSVHEVALAARGVR